MIKLLACLSVCLSVHMYLSATIYVLKWHSLQLDPIARAERSRVFGTLLKPGREILSAFFVAECDIPLPQVTASVKWKVQWEVERAGGAVGGGRQMIFRKLSD